MPVNYAEGGTSNNGRIIQVVSTFYGDRSKYTNFTGNSFVNTFNDIDTTITPKLASSKLMFFVNINYGCESNTGSIFFQIREGTSTVIQGLNGNNQAYGHRCFHQSRWSHGGSQQAEYTTKRAIINGAMIDAGSTSARTYKIYTQVQTGGLDVTINRDGSNASDTNTGQHSPASNSYMTIMEVSDV